MSSPSGKMGSPWSSGSGWRPRRSSISKEPSTPKAAISGSRSAPMMLGGIAENNSPKKKKPDAYLQTAYGQGYLQSKDTYGTLSAKARGTKCHNGPLELRKSLPGRDCTSWVREDKQYSPYSYFENPANKPSPKPKKPSAPPPLWLPPRAKDPKAKKKAAADNMRLGAEAGEDEADNEALEIVPEAGAGLEQRPPWDSEHHVMFSRMNAEVQVGCREYFGKPIKKEGEGVPKVREQYRMSDRQCGWDDTPAPLGEYRKTLYDNIGPYNKGGCKEQQLPSYWRKIKDWNSYSEPDLLSLTNTGRFSEKLKQEQDKQALMKALADAPAGKSKEFWRGWAEAQAAPGTMPGKGRYDAPKGWDDRWNVCPSRANNDINQRQREYFSVPAGSTGQPTEKLRPRRSMRSIERAAETANRFAD